MLSGSVRWRFPIAFQSFFTIIVIIGLRYLPDSPRWLAMRGRHAEARDVTARLLGKKEDDPEVEQELKVVRGELEVQSKGAGFKFRGVAYEWTKSELEEDGYVWIPFSSTYQLRSLLLHILECRTGQPCSVARPTLAGICSTNRQLLVQW